MRNIRLYIKDIFYHFVQRRIRKFPVAILMYHSIGLNSHFFTVSPASFREQMEHLKKYGYRVLSLSQIVGQLIRGEKIASKSVALTFDDGYEDNFKNAFPVLKEMNFPATIFVSTDFIGSERLVRGVNMRHLSREQVLEMQTSGLVDFEPHGQSHRRLTELSQEEFETEMSGSKSVVSDLIGLRCRLFAYPFGDSNSAIRAVARKLFSGAVGIRRGYVSPRSDIFNLERQSVDSLTTPARFRLKI